MSDINEVFGTDNKSDQKEKSKPNKAIFLTAIGALLVFGIVIFNPFGGSQKKKNPNVQAAVASISNNQPQPLFSTQQGNGVNIDERLNAQEMDIETIRKNIEMMQKDQQSLYKELGDKLDAVQAIKGSSGGGGGIISPLNRASRLSERFSADYQTKVSHFKLNKSNGWEMEESKYAEMTSLQNSPKSISIADTISGGAFSGPGFNYNIPAGSRIVAITEQPVNSDHPGYFTSRIVRPEVLRGATLICQNGPQQNNRIPVAVTKIVFNNDEYQVSGQVEMGFPGMTGSVNRHFGKILPVLANAAISGGFIAWSATNQTETRIDTRDAITGAVVEQTLPQVQNEITKFSTDRPNTVEVASGTQFSVLLTDKLNLRYSL
jgi:type IV secretory pathway VirB10-like protein